MIRVEDLVFGYRRDESPIINGLHAEFPAGTVTALTGPSGCGKSTLMYLLGLMLTPRSGRILLDDHDAAAMNDGQRADIRASSMGFVFQDALLDPARTILDNVLEGGVYAGRIRSTLQSAARELLAELGVDHRIDHRPGQISGGQAQRVALCRALLGDPDYILADEPTGNLDSGTAELVWSLFAEQSAKGKTVIVATHDSARAATADSRIDLVAS